MQINKNTFSLKAKIDNYTIFKRTTRNIILTDAGRYLYHQASDLLSNLDKSLIKTASFYSHPQGRLKITCSIAFGTLHLMKLFVNTKWVILMSPYRLISMTN